MFSKISKPNKVTSKTNKSKPMSKEAKRKQHAAIVGYYVNKRKEENKR